MDAPSARETGQPGRLAPDRLAHLYLCRELSTCRIAGLSALVRVLYADDLIAAALIVHDVPQVPPDGPIWERFSEPVPLSAPLVKDLYWSCGAALNHVELPTGQPAMTVRGFMRREGIPLRPPAGLSPFLRRWRAGQ